MKRRIATAVIAILLGICTAQGQAFKGVKLGEVVNSDADELAPLVSADGKFLYFVRALHEDNIGGEEEVRQDVWVSRKLRTGKWDIAANLGAPINNIADNGIGGIASNGKSIFVSNIYNSFGNCIAPGISSAFSTAKGWLAPKAVYEPKNISKTRSFGFYVVPGGEAIILSMATEQSPENEDLYVVLKEGNGWSEPINLGARINTAGYEIAPFLSYDGKRLFFTSTGHKGLGGADVFFVDRLDDSWSNWSKAVNLGPEVNTEGFEAYFSIDTVNKRGYFVADMGAEYSDIYSIDLNKIPALNTPEEVVVVKEEPEEEPKEEVVVVKEEPKEEPIEEVVVVKEKPKEIPKEEVVVVKEKPKEIPKEEVVVVKEKPKEIPKDPTPISSGNVQTAYAKVYFPFNGYLLTSDERNKVRAVVDYLVENPKATVKLDGHADSVGADSVNNVFGEVRCESIKNYLMDKGIDAARISIVSFGERNPIAPNESADGRKQNRRVEIYLLKD